MIDLALLCLFSGELLGQTVIRTLTGPPGAAIADSYGPGGDLTGDGVGDVVAGAMQPSGTVFVFSGVDGVIAQTITAPIPFVGFGHSVAGGTDISGDGVPDILVGAYLGPQQEGRVYVYSGASFTLIRTHVGVAGQNLGEPVVFLDDLDGDQVPEYAAGATHDSGTFRAPEVGQAYVYSGATGVTLYPLIGEHAGDLFGDAIASMGLVDGDAVPDFAVGASEHNGHGKQKCGAVYLYSGANGGLIRKDVGTSQFSFLGHSVIGLGDVDGDLRGDYGTSWYPGTNGALVISGLTGTVLTQVQARTTIPLAPGIGSVQDADGDGKRDLLLAHWVINGPGGGTVSVVGSVSGSELFRIDDPATASPGFPGLVVSVGDLDGDAREDIGALDLFDDPGGGGRIYVFSTRALYALSATISAAPGGSVEFELNAGAPNAGMTYWLLAGVSGTSPGFHVGFADVPLNFDLLSEFSVLLANTAPFVDTVGTLGAGTGKGFATFDLTGMSLPSAAIGATLYYCYLVKGDIGTGSPVWHFASNPQAVLIVP